MSLLRQRERVTVDVLNAATFYGQADGAYSEETARRSARGAAKERGMKIKILSVRGGNGNNWVVEAMRVYR